MTAEPNAASLRGLPSLTLRSFNRSISDVAIAPSKFLASLGTSDMPKKLYAISLTGRIEDVEQVNRNI